MYKLAVIAIALMLCIILVACQGPRPQPAATPQPLQACATGPGQPWRFWQSASVGVSSLLVEGGVVWAGTQAGVFRIHPRTSVFTFTLDSQVSGQVNSLFPMGEERVWATAERGNFYYDGKRWTTVQLAGTGNNPIPLAIDLEGNLWMYSYGVKPEPSYYRLPGHVPPTDGSAWGAMAMDLKPGSDECQAQRGWARSSQSMLSFFYLSQTECQSLMRARPDAEKMFGNYMVLDADGSVWSISHGDSPTGARDGYPATLRNLDLSIELNLPDYGLPRIAPDPVRGVWLGMGSGLAYSDGKSLREVPLTLGECRVPSPLHDLTIDPHGKAWTAVGGKVRMLESGEAEWQNAPDPVQIESGTGRLVYGLALAADGGLWTSRGQELSRLGGGTSMPPTQLPERDCVLTALVADARSVWGNIQCRQPEYYGIVQFDLTTRSWTRHKLYPAGSRSVAITSDGNVYAMAQDGVYLYTGAEWRRVVETTFYMMIADKQNGLWLASGANDLWYYKDGKLTSHGQPFNSNRSMYLTVDGRNRLWATGGDTLYVHDGKAWRSISTPVKSINELQASPDGRIWLVGYNGLAVYDPAMDK